MKEYIHHKELVLPVSSEQLWDFISNTEHLNRMVGLPAVKYSAPESSPAGTFRWAEGSIAPLGLLRWQEFPFEWVKPHGYRVRRIFERGPFQELNGEVDVEPHPEGSLLRVGVRIIARGLVGRFVVTPVAKKAVKDTLDYSRKAISEEQGKIVLNLPMPANIKVDRKQLVKAQDRLKEMAPRLLPLIHWLVYFLISRSDEEVLGMRPFALADRWQHNRRDLLRLFLHATRAGMLELEWQLKCPFCRISKSSYRTLSDLNPRYHCDFCGIDYNADLDVATELKFNVSPAIRKTDHQIYCIGSPVNSPHILAQQRLAPGETKTRTAKVHAGEYRFRVLQKNTSFRVQSSTEAATISRISVTFDGQGWTGDANYFSPPALELIMKNSSKEPVVVVFEDVSPDSQAVSAAFVSVLPEFRNHFGSEALAAGQDIAVRRLCLMFTDLKGSSALYEAVGDASALGRVYKHFDYLREIIERNSGSVVKVMGDAVMAAFYFTSDGVRAALEIQDNIDKFNRENSFEPPMIIKLGLHQGPAFVVNGNGKLDYFGKTVNMAARLQQISEGGDIICSDEVIHEPGVEEVWVNFPATGERMEVSLKGFKDVKQVYQLKL